jgi:phage terminase Nu1 subunit (DNA packaging protein)
MDEINDFKDRNAKPTKTTKGGKVSNKAPTYPVATIAKLLMLSDRRVQQLTKEGVIPKAERGRYELAPAVQGYIRFLQERSLRSDSSPIDYHVEKARLTQMQASLAEIELVKARGDVVSVDQVTKNLAGLFAEVRTNIRNIPGRVVSSLIGMTDEREFKAVLLREIDLVLTALAEADVLVEPSDDDEDAGADGQT